MPAVAAALRRAAAGRAPQGPLGLCFKGPNIRGPPRRGPRTLCTLSLQQQRIPTPHVFPLLSSSSCSSCCSSSWFAGVSFVGSPAVSSFLRSRGPPPKGGGPDGPLPFGFCYFSRGFASSSMRGAPMEDPPSPGSPSRAPQSAQAVHSSSSRADPGGPHWGSPSLGRARVGSPGPDEGGAPRGRFGGPWGSPPFPSLHSGGLMDETTETAMRKTALNCLCLFFCLCGVAFAFVPLYAAFCNATGYGGAIKGVNHRQDDQQIPNRQRNAHQHKMKGSSVSHANQILIGVLCLFLSLYLFIIYIIFGLTVSLPASLSPSCSLSVSFPGAAAVRRQPEGD